MFIDFFIGKCEDIRYSTIAKQCSFVVGNRGQKGTQSDSQLDEVPGQQLRQKVRYKKTKKLQCQDIPFLHRWLTTSRSVDTMERVVGENKEELMLKHNIRLYGPRLQAE